MEENKLQIIEAYCELSPISLKFRREVTKQEWQKVFNALTLFDKCIHFWIGDCLAYKKQSWGMYDELVDKTGFDKKTLMNDKVVANQIESSLRRDDLSFTHHALVAPLEPEQQDKWLTKASEKKLTVKELREEIKKDRPIIPLPERGYNIIYADPPWQFDNAGFTQSAASIYPTMSTEEICELPIKNLILDNSVLFLWSTNAMLTDALQVIEKWGFTYKTNFVWIKDKAPGMGWFTESKHELLLISVNGKGLHPQWKPQSWVKKDRTAHSKKPEIFYEIIEKMYPGQKYIELFARNKRNGWKSWGNEIPEN